MKYKNMLYRIFIIVYVFLFTQLSGCANAPVYPMEMAEWTRFSEIKGCITYLPKWKEPHDINVELKPDTEKLLMSYLAGKKLESPSCWYETPAGSLMLRSGPFCGAQKEAEFKKLESGWALTAFDESLSFCHEKRQ